MILKKTGHIAAFPSLDSLKLHGISADCDYMLHLFKHLDSTLRVLDFGPDLPNGLEALHNLREVHMCNYSLTKDMTLFWGQNKNIRRIYIGDTDPFDWTESERFPKVCQNCGNGRRTEKNLRDMRWFLTHLELLSLRYCVYTNFYDPRIFIESSLRELHLWTWLDDGTILQFLARFKPYGLKCISVSWEDRKVSARFELERYSQLEEGKCRYYIDTENDIQPMKNLKRLKLFSESPSRVFKLIEEWPLLHSFMVKLWKSSC